jgi:hypothetical protein
MDDFLTIFLINRRTEYTVNTGLHLLVLFDGVWNRWHKQSQPNKQTNKSVMILSASCCLLTTTILLSIVKSFSARVLLG